MAFEFVNNATIDPKARKLIRSHVAKGRNVGKKRQPKCRPTQAATRCARLYSSSAPFRSLAAKNTQMIAASQKEIPEFGRQIGDGWSVMSFPDDIAPNSRYVVHKAFLFLSGPHGSPALRNVIDYNGGGSQMIAFMFVDEAYFHCAIAMCYKSLGALSLGEDNYSEAMRHISQSYRLINERLSGDKALDDATMVAILAMTHWERIQGRHRDSVTHLQGLLRIVALRGGISQFAREQPFLAHKVFRSDLEISLHVGSSTRFSLRDISEYCAETWLRLGFESGHDNEDCRTQTTIQSGISLSDVLANVAHFAFLLNHYLKFGKRIHQSDFNNSIMLLGYRLIHISPLNGPRPANAAEDILHFGLAGFLTSFLLEIGARPQVFPLLTHTACTAIEVHSEDSVQYHEALLWALFVGASSTFSRLDDRWMTAKVTDTMVSLDLDTWDDVLRTVSKFPWVNRVHDQPGQALWRKTRPSHANDDKLK